MELMNRIRELLMKEYGISSDEELMQEIKKQRAADIGIFVSPCGMEEHRVQAVS